MVKVFFLFNDLVQLYFPDDDLVKFNQVYHLVRCGAGGQVKDHGVDIHNSIIVSKSDYLKLRDDKLFIGCFDETSADFLKVLVNIENGVVIDVVANTPACRVVIIDQDDNAEEPIVIQDHLCPDTTVGKFYEMFQYAPKSEYPESTKDGEARMYVYNEFVKMGF